VILSHRGRPDAVQPALEPGGQRKARHVMEHYAMSERRVSSLLRPERKACRALYHSSINSHVIRRWKVTRLLD
jgi:hypothetical protein